MKSVILRFKKILNKYFDRITGYAKSHNVFKNKSVTIYDFFNYFFQGVQNQSLNIRASALSFKFFISLFPFTIFFFTLLPYFSSEQFQETFMLTLQSIMPEYTFKAFENVIRDILYKPRFGLMSVSFFVALIISVSNMNAIMKTLNVSFHLKYKRSLLSNILISSLLTFLFFALILFALLTITLNMTMFNWFIDNEFFDTSYIIPLITYLRWIILFFVLLFGLSLFYTISPAYNFKFRFFNIGSIFASFFCILLSLGFDYFIFTFSFINKFYGALAVVFIFFFWLYYISLILIIGFEINTSLYIAPEMNQEDNV